LITLALDTTGSWCTSVLVTPARVLANPSEKIGRGHAERLPPMVVKTLEMARIRPDQIDRIAVCTGPGSFTGLRVALAFARSFALPHKIPVIGITALHALATQADPTKNQNIISVINAKRGELCWAEFSRGLLVAGPFTQEIQTAKAIINQKSFDHMVGDGAELLGHHSQIDHADGPVLAWMSEGLLPGDYPPDPLYARGPDAKLPGGKSP